MIRGWLYRFVSCRSRWKSGSGLVFACDRPRWHPGVHMSGHGTQQVEWWDEHAVRRMT